MIQKDTIMGINAFTYITLRKLLKLCVVLIEEILLY